MVNLTNIEEIKKLDPKDVYGSTGMFIDQCQYMFDTYFNVEFFTPEYKAIRNIVVCGMGGSAYGGYIASSLYQQELKVPLLTLNDYHLPGFVDKDSLVMVVSYSGTTEEPVNCSQEALQKNAKIAGFSTGGIISEFLKDKYPGFTFIPQFNPSGQPRLGTGYIVMGTLVLLKSLGVIEMNNDEVLKAIDEVRNSQEEIKNKAIELAQKIQGHIPVIFASQHLVGNAHILRNQFNETSKSFSAFEDIPELNHHLMEGLKNPAEKKLISLFITSGNYSEKHAKRVKLTEDVVRQNGVDVLEYKPSGSSRLSEVLNTLSFGGYITLYLALLYGQDPSVIPWVDYFKQKLP